MSVTMDRLKASIFAIVRAATARLPYAAPRFARVVKATTASDGSTTLDVVAEDPAFQVPGGVPLFHGLPGVTLTLGSGTRVLVEFSEADPAKPFVRSWAGGEQVTSLGIAGSTPVALASIVNGYFSGSMAEHTHPVAGVQTGTSAVVSGPSAELAAPPDVSAQVLKTS